MKKHTSTYCNVTGHLFAILDGTSIHSTFDQVAFHGRFYKGVRENDKCVVNVPKSCSWTKTDCQSKVNKFKELHKWSKLGRKELNFRVSVYVPTIVRLRKVTKWFKKQVNYPVVEGDFVLVGELIEGQRQEFIGIDGNVQPYCPLALSEFLHYTYHRSDSQLVACGFHGVSDGDSVHLSEPTIHSKSGSFGASDDGPSGIRRVFQNHTCSDICRNWKLPALEKKVPIPGWTPSRIEVMHAPFGQQNNNHQSKCRLPAYDPTNNLPPSYHPTDTLVNLLSDNQTQPILQEHHSPLDHLNPHYAPQDVPPHTTWANTSQLHPIPPPSYEL